MSDHRLPDGSVPVLLSSDSAEGLRAEARAILTYLREHPDTTPQDLSRTLFRTRIARPHRALIMAEDHELSAALRSIADGEEHPDVVRSRRPASARTIGFVFPGQGSQQAGMGAVYYRHSPEYRSVVDEYAALHEERYGNRGPVHYLLGDREGHEPTLLDLIQTQEKLCWNYGRKRKSIAMGVYRTELMQYPVKYFAADPDKTKFVPLGLERELSLRQIISEHPKGQEFGQIVAEFPRFPFLTDANDEVLSFPPVINSAKIGAVEVGDTNLFVELTGTDYPSLMLTASIVACDLADAGFTIRPVAVEYPYDTVFGRTVTTPLYFQTPVTLEVPYAEKLLGERFTAEEIVGYLAKMGVRAAAAGSKITVTPPEYRNDFLHPVDVIEDIMVGRGMDSFEPVMPEDFTVGRLTAAERFGRQVKNLMVGLGYQEMIYGYLGSKKDYVERMNIPGDEVIRIANPMTESFEFVRPSILPSLLYTESVSGNAAYPHFVFEVGKVAWIDPDQNYGTRTVNSLGLLAADKDAGFNLIYSHLTALMFYLSREFTIREIEDPRFIPGRTAAVMAGDRKIGVFGELHPAVLSNWGITMPCAGGELDLDLLRGE